MLAPELVAHQDFVRGCIDFRVCRVTNPITQPYLTGRGDYLGAAFTLYLSQRQPQEEPFSFFLRHDIELPCLCGHGCSRHATYKGQRRFWAQPDNRVCNCCDDQNVQIAIQTSDGTPLVFEEDLAYWSSIDA